jgi:hypothetical protein
MPVTVSAVNRGFMCTVTVSVWLNIAKKEVGKFCLLRFSVALLVSRYYVHLTFILAQHLTPGTALWSSLTTATCIMYGG